MFRNLKKPILLITYAILLFFLVTNFQAVLNFIFWVIGLFAPFLFGFVIAFVLNRPFNFFRYKVFGFMDKMKGEHLPAFRKILSLVIVYLLFFLIVSLVIFAVIPQLAESINKLIGNLDGYIRSLETFGNQLLEYFGVTSGFWDTIDSYLSDFYTTIGKVLTNDVVPYLINTTGSIITGLSNFFLGLVTSIYLLAGKEKLMVQGKRLIRAVIPEKPRAKMNHIWLLSNRMFGDFVIGQLANAAIVGILCFIGMSILGLDYALLISVLVCVSNVIPFFGCIIGAVPSAFILLMVDPLQSLWFIIFIIVLQTIDGNIICPKVVGDSIGLSGLWVMVSIVVGGSIFGIVGIFLGVPLFAVLYALVRDFTIRREEKLAGVQTAPRAPDKATKRP